MYLFRTICSIEKAIDRLGKRVVIARAREQKSLSVAHLTPFKYPEVDWPQMRLESTLRFLS